MVLFKTKVFTCIYHIYHCYKYCDCCISLLEIQWFIYFCKYYIIAPFCSNYHFYSMFSKYHHTFFFVFDIQEWSSTQPTGSNSNQTPAPNVMFKNLKMKTKTCLGRWVAKNGFVFSSQTTTSHFFPVRWPWSCGWEVCFRRMSCFMALAMLCSAPEALESGDWQKQVFWEATSNSSHWEVSQVIEVPPVIIQVITLW